MAERNVWKTQQELILRESSRLFWENGYAETSMRDIAEACGFRPANIYNFFKSKETILFEILREEMMDVVSPIRGLKDDDTLAPDRALYLFIENHVKLTLGEKSSSKLLFDVALKNLSPENRRAIVRLRDDYDRIGEAIIHRGIGQGLFSETDEKLAVFSIASIIARSRIWYSPRGKYSVQDIVDFVYGFAMNGLSGGAGKPHPGKKKGAGRE